VSLFPDMRAQRLRLLAELRALEAEEQGLTAAKIVPTPEEKPSMTKALIFLAGIGAVVGWACYGRSFMALFGEGSEDEAPAREKTTDEAKKMIDKIKLFDMEEAVKQLEGTKPTP